MIAIMSQFLFAAHDFLESAIAHRLWATMLRELSQIEALHGPLAPILDVLDVEPPYLLDIGERPCLDVNDDAPPWCPLHIAFRL